MCKQKPQKMKNYFSYFSIDGVTPQPIKGITNGETWNGWATPYFEKSTMLEIIENYNLHSEDGSKLEFSEEKNCVVYVDSEDIYEQSTLTHEGETYYTCDGFCWIEEEKI